MIKDLFSRILTRKYLVSDLDERVKIELDRSELIRQDIMKFTGELSERLSKPKMATLNGAHHKAHLD